MIYAKTFSPENSSIDIEDYFNFKENGIIVEGNQNFIGINDDDLKTVRKLCDDLDFDCQEEAGYYGLTDEQFDKLRKITNKEDFIIEFLSMKYGKPYKKATIRGCCQRDWAEIYLPLDYAGMIKEFESVFFNLGTKVMIDMFDRENIDPEEISGYCLYIPSTDEDEIKKRIADNEGVKPEEVKLYMFDGYIKTPKYRVA